MVIGLALSISFIKMAPAAKPCLFLRSASMCALLCISTHARSLIQVSGLVALLLRVRMHVCSSITAFPLKVCSVDRSIDMLGSHCQCAASVAGILLRKVLPIHTLVLCRVQVLQAAGTPMMPRSPQQQSKGLRPVRLLQNLAAFFHCTSCKPFPVKVGSI